MEHIDYNLTAHFMGKHPGEFHCDIDKENGTISGEAVLNMKIKKIRYPFTTGTVVYNDDGSVVYNAQLKSMFGNGTLDATVNVDPDGNVTGGVPKILTWDGHI